MSFWPLDNPAECEQAFRERYHRPPPWHELVPLEELEDLAWKLGERAGMRPSSLRLDKVCRTVWEVMEKKNREMAGAYRGWTEPLGSARERLRFPTDGAVLLWRELSDRAVRMRCADLLAFQDLLWRDDSWVIDEDGLWMLVGVHDWAACWVDFRGRV